MYRTLKALEKECKDKNLPIPLIKYTRQDLVDILAQESLRLIQNPSWALLQRLKIVSPMLCFQFKNLHQHEQKRIMDSTDWIAEKKQNGNRQIIFYHPEEGFHFFSRNVSVEDYLPVCYTENVLLIKDNKVSTPESFKGLFKRSFILDSEVVVENPNIDTALYSTHGVVTGSELNAVSAIMALNPVASKKIQMEQAPLKFMVFDILHFDGEDVQNRPLRIRRKLLEEIVSKLNTILPLHISEYVIGEAKQEFFNQIIKEGGEGVVLKNLNSTYISTTSRSRTTQVKLKRSFANTVKDSADLNPASDFDVFITGFVPSKEDKGWSHLIGALECSVILRRSDGSEKEHHICSISGIPMELREKMTIKDKDGKPTLNPEYLNRVITVDGQSVTSRSLRLAHATCEWSRGFRTDKTYLDCIIDELVLLENVM